MLKGTTKIELTNVKTGEKEVYRHDNMITNAINDILTLNPDGFKSLAAHNSILYPIIPNLIGGILLCENPLEEDPAKYWVPNDNPIVGYSGNTVNSGANPQRGSMNQTESGELEDGTGYRFVFDFATSQGNGTISALGLTSATGGLCGKGNMYNTAMGMKTVMAKVDAGTSDTISSDVDYACWLADITALCPEKNEAIAIRWTAANTFKIRRFKFSLQSVGLFDNPATLPSNRNYTEETITTSTFGASTSTDKYFAFVDGGDGYIWGFEHSGNANGNSSGNATVNWIKISIADSTFEEGTWTLAAQLMGFGYCPYYTRTTAKYTRRGTRCIIHKGYLYCVNYTATGIYKIELANPSNIVFMAHPGGAVYTEVQYSYGSSSAYSYYCGTVFNVMYDTVYFMNGYIQDDTIIATTYTAATSNSTIAHNYNSPLGLRCTAKPGLRVGPFRFDFYYQQDSGVFRRWYITTFLANYLATINNLETPVQKTADKTMKITYILREE